MSERARIGLLLGVLVIAYGNSLLNGFTMDDRLYIFINPAVTAPSVAKLFFPNQATAVFRLFTFAVLALNFLISGEHAFGYHLVNLLLHAAVTVLLYFVLRKLLDRQPYGNTAAWVAAILFAVHPIHTEAVSSIIGRAELLAAGLMLAGWLLHLYDRPILAMACFALALLSKESAVGLLPLVPIGDYVRGKLKPFRHYAGLAILVVIYISLLWFVQGKRFGASAIDFSNNPLAALPASIRIPNALRIGWKYVGLLVYPKTLSCDYSYNSIHLYATWRHFLPAILATICVLAAWFWTFYADKRVWFLAGAMYAAGFVITGNVIMAAGPPMGERLAYFPSAGFCLCAALLWASLDKRFPKVAGPLLLVVVLALAARTWVRNRDWKDNMTLFLAGEQAEPESIKMHNFVFAQYVARGNDVKAAEEARVILQLYPPFPEDLKLRGISEYDYRLVKEAERHTKLGEADDALAFLEIVLKRSPNFSLAWSERAAANYQLGNAASARADAQAALRLDPDNFQAQDLLQLMESNSSR